MIPHAIQEFHNDLDNQAEVEQRGPQKMPQNRTLAEARGFTSTGEIHD